MLALFNTPLVIAQGQLSWMGPIVGGASKLQSGATWVGLFFFVVFLGAPAIALLAGSRAGSWFRRAPYLWMAPLVAGAAVIPFVNVDNIGWGTLTVLPYLMWATVACFVGLLHGGVQTLRFVVSPREKLSTWDVALRKTVYGVGALLSGATLLLGALIDLQPFFGLFGAIVVMVGVAVLATRHGESHDRWPQSSQSDRVGRVLGAAGLAFFAAPTGLLVVMLIAELIKNPTLPHPLALFLLAIPVTITAGSAYLFRRCGTESKRRSAEVVDDDSPP